MLSLWSPSPSSPSHSFPSHSFRLNQLYAMAYGTVPIVHAVGGLRDTVKHFNPNENSGKCS